MEFYITDHSADSAVTGSEKKLKKLYADIKRDGIDSVRYDWRWDLIEPEPGRYSGEHLARYARAKELMQDAGLGTPTIILSNLPAWAESLYEEDRETFFKRFAHYAYVVSDVLCNNARGPKITTVQVLNELNNTWFTPVSIKEFPRLCESIRNAFAHRNCHPHIKLMGTILAANIPGLVPKMTMGKVSFGTPIENYLPMLREVKDCFDIIAVDYYPVVWHCTRFPWQFRSLRRFYKATVKDLDLLRSTLEEIATWGIEYELGEAGMRTNMRDGEKSQRYFYSAFFSAFKHLLLEFEARRLPLPSRIGFYEALDERPRNFWEAIGRVLMPYPENDMGMRTRNGKRKLILKGSMHCPKEEACRQLSQLHKIIAYLRTPLKKVMTVDG